MSEYDEAYQQAMALIDKEWLVAGYTQADLDRADKLAKLFAQEIVAGRSVEEVAAEWEEKGREEILKKYGLT